MTRADTIASAGRMLSETLFPEKSLRANAVIIYTAVNNVDNGMIKNTVMNCTFLLRSLAVEGHATII